MSLAKKLGLALAMGGAVLSVVSIINGENFSASSSSLFLSENRLTAS
jgi:hypothetical protein